MSIKMLLHDGPAPIQPKNRYGRTFQDLATLEQLIAEQGVKLIRDIDELVGDFWPEDEDPDEFVNWLCEERRPAAGCSRIDPP